MDDMNGLDLLGADDAAATKGGKHEHGEHGDKKGAKESKPGLSDGAKIGITEGVMLAGAVGGAILGSRLVKAHSFLGAVGGFLGGALVLGGGTAALLNRKST